MEKSLLSHLNEIFELYACHKGDMKQDMRYRSDALEATYIKRCYDSCMCLELTSEASMEELGMLPTPDSEYSPEASIPVEVSGDMHYARASKEKVMAWVRKVDEEATAGKRMAIYEWHVKPFSIRFDTAKILGIGMDTTPFLDDKIKEIEKIIRANKKLRVGKPKC
jgi:hypothetical protein